MGFQDRTKYHDYILETELPDLFKRLGIHFQRRGYEVALKDGNLLITQLEDITAHNIRFMPDGVAEYKNSYLVELKTKLPTQDSENYSYEMKPWEQAVEAHKQGNLIVYHFWPDKKVCWVNDTKPDWIIVPKWKWSEQDFLRVKHRYSDIAPVIYKDVEGGSGTIGGIILVDRIRAMKSFERFWLEVLGQWINPKQLPLTM